MTIRIRRMANGDTACNGADVCGSAVRTYLAQGDVKPITLDLSALLPTTGTIDSASKVEGNATLSTPAISGQTVTANLTGSSGANYADIQATLSTGEKVTQRILAIENTQKLSRDYEG